MKRLVVLSLFALSCQGPADPSATPTNSQSGSTCSVQGNGNTVICAPATPTPTPAVASCVPQTAPFVCSKGTPVFQSILEAAQRSVPATPEPIYVAALVSALNQNPSVCAISGPASDEVTIKARTSNVQSETWDVVRADGAIQAIPSAPSPICSPSRF